MSTVPDFAPNSPEAFEYVESVKRGERCPDCESMRTESNGRREYRCIDCDYRWGFDGEWYGV